MKHKRIHTSSVTRAFAALLLLLMISLEMLQAVHTHTCIGDEHPEEVHFSSEVAKCKVCDYFAQQRYEPFESIPVFELHRPVSSFFKANATLVVGIREFALEHWSNKGPPSLA
ncbi:MAG: hypothetical protein EOO09_08025 [Chitinophagaceae bacterium]|nr:MAG: hypothetical protein EOO09_08025 [Chitinophagaceae bacterium]